MRVCGKETLGGHRVGSPGPPPHSGGFACPCRGRPIPLRCPPPSGSPGELGVAHHPGRALPTPHPLSGPRLASRGRRASPLHQWTGHRLGRSGRDQARPHKQRRTSRGVSGSGAPDVTAVPTAAGWESPDHPGNARGACGGRCPSAAPPPRGPPAPRERGAAAGAGLDARDATRLRLLDRFSETPNHLPLR